VAKDEVIKTSGNPSEYLIIILSGEIQV
jgi:hypothetical protein